MRPNSLLNILAFALVLTVNYLSISAPLNGRTPAQLSDLYPNLFVPAGLTFAIWGVIYTWLLVWVGAQVVALFNGNIRERIEPGVQKAGWWFPLTCFLNAAWLFAWHWQQVLLSVLIMVGLLWTLWQLNQALLTGIPKADQREKWLLHAPLGLYQGWITIALIANVTALLVSYGWHGGSVGERDWTFMMILAGTMVSNMVVRKTNNVFHSLAVAWALAGIALKRSAAGDAGNLVTISALCAVLVLFWAGMRWRQWLAY